MAAGKEKGQLASAAVYKAEFALYDPNGIKTKEKSLVLDNKIKGYYTDQLYVANPVLWDAEHPRLYRFELILYKLDSISGTWEPLEQINNATSCSISSLVNARPFLGLISWRHTPRNFTSLWF